MTTTRSDHPSIRGPLILVALLAPIVYVCVVLTGGGAASAESGSGASIYASKCASCHQANGAGIPGTFPPLKGNPDVADPAYVASVVKGGKTGELVIDGVTYNGTMPAVPGLSDDEVAQVAEYVASLSAGGTAATVAPATPPEPGKPDEGQALFIGATRLGNGAAACTACHNAGEVGNFGGSTLGPDLTDVSSRLGGEAGLSAWLKTPPSPTMTPIFSKHPLSDAEIADVVAFLVAAPDQPKSSPKVDWLAIGGAIGAVVLIGGMAIAWRGMRQTYVERLRSRR